MLWRVIVFLMAIGGCQRSRPADTPASTAPLMVASACKNQQGDPLPTPTNGAEIHHWLVNGCYKGWPAWSKPKMSDFAEIPVRVYLSPSLKDSLAQKPKTHPVGVAAVREQYAGDDSGKVTGYSMMIKTRVDDGLGNGWFFYEAFDTRDVAVPNVAGYGDRNCAGCHSHANDFIQSTLPLP